MIKKEDFKNVEKNLISKYFILANNNEDYLNFCKENKLDPYKCHDFYDKEELLEVENINTINGVSNILKIDIR